MKKALISVLFMACLAFSATINVAVIETEIDAGSDAAKEIKPAELRYITNEIRRLATNSLPKPKYSIMTEQTVQAQGDAVLQECDGENCIISLGEKIGADFITRGTLSKFRKNYTLTVEIYDTRNGMLAVGLDEPIESEKVEDLLIGFRKIAPSFFGKLDNSKPAVPRPESAVLGAGRIESNIGESSGGSMRLPQWVGIGLAAAGLGLGVYGILQNGEYKSLHGKYNDAQTAEDAVARRKDAEDAGKRRNLGYIIGGALLAGGITVYFVF